MIQKIRQTRAISLTKWDSEILSEFLIFRKIDSFEASKSFFDAPEFSIYQFKIPSKLDESKSQ